MYDRRLKRLVAGMKKNPQQTLQQKGLGQRMFQDSSRQIRKNAQMQAESFFGMTGESEKSRMMPAKNRKAARGQYISQNWQKFLK
jgi:hypothetical protein